MNTAQLKSLIALVDCRPKPTFWRQFFDLQLPVEDFLLNSKETLSEFELTPDDRKKLEKSLGETKILDEKIAIAERLKINAVLWGDEHYPRLLMDLQFPPPVLFYRGNIQKISPASASIVGARAYTSYGQMVTEQIAQRLCDHDVNVVSGLAEGIDSTAHQSALKAGGFTIGVAGCGLDVNYPVSNKRMRERMAEEGLLLSAYAPKTPPNRHHFPERNQVIAGLSQLTIVVEAAEKSGSLITARLAAEFGRDVAAVPGDITRKSSVGANKLIGDGAYMISTLNDVIDYLRPYLKDQPAQAKGNKTTPSPMKGSTPEETFLLNQIHHEPKTLDELTNLAEENGINRGTVAQLLLQLELSGKIKQTVGGRYQLGKL